MEPDGSMYPTRYGAILVHLTTLPTPTFQAGPLVISPRLSKIGLLKVALTNHLSDSAVHDGSSPSVQLHFIAKITRDRSYLRLWTSAPSDES